MEDKLMKYSMDLDELSDEKNKLVHFCSLSELVSYLWIDSKGNIIDMRKINISYLKNIRDWCLKNSCYGDSHVYTAYDETPQFKYVCKRIQRLEDRMREWSERLKGLFP
jgi:hypothetical protein